MQVLHHFRRRSEKRPDQYEEYWRTNPFESDLRTDNPRLELRGAAMGAAIIRTGPDIDGLR